MRGTLIAMGILIGSFARSQLAVADTVVANEDRNLVIRVQDALSDGSRTRIAFDTTPDITQAHVAEACAANVYVLDVEAGLPEAKPQRVAEKFCGRSGMLDRLLDNGDLLLISGDRVERWAPGRGQVSAWRLGDNEALSRRLPEIDESTTPIDVTRSGIVVAGVSLARARNDVDSPTAAVLSFSADGTLLWERELSEPGVTVGILDIWAAPDGGAWVHAAARPSAGASLPSGIAPAGMIVMRENRLYRLSDSGVPTASAVLASTTMPDPSVPPPDVSDADDLQAFLQRNLGATAGQPSLDGLAEGDLVAHVRDDGGIDIVAGRSTRSARFLRVDRGGRITLEKPLSETMRSEGLTSWYDFAADGDALVLFGIASVPGNRLPQAYLSSIDLRSGQTLTRLVPLNSLGIDAARRASDAEVRNLEHNPSQTPALLTELAGEPLVVTLIRRSRRPALQLDVIDESNERLSNAAALPAANVPRGLPQGSPASPEDFATQIAAAMAQMQQAMAAAGVDAADIPGLPAGLVPPGTEVPALDPSLAALFVPVNAALQATARYTNPAGGKIDLVVLSKRTGAELLRKTFADGVIDETVDLGAYRLPLADLAIVYKDAGNRVVGNPALVPMRD